MKNQDTENNYEQKRIKSLKGGDTNPTMLAQTKHEREIETIPLKKNQTMEITTHKLAVYNSKKIIMSIPITDVRSISPIRKGEIRVQFHKPRQLDDGRSVFERKYTDHSLEKNDLGANQICRKIQKEHERLNTRTKNTHGFLMLHGWEHIVNVYEDIDTNKGRGLFYITNNSLALETKDGIVFDVPFEFVTLVTEHKKKIRVMWSEPWRADNFRFDFKMNKDLDTNVVRTQINRVFSEYRKNIGYDYIQLEKKFGRLSYDEMFALIDSQNPEFRQYLAEHVKHTFGYAAPKFDSLDANNIRTCKLLGLPLSLIDGVSDEEEQQRKESIEYFEKVRIHNKKYDALYDVQIEMEKDCKTKEEMVELQSDKKYKEIINTLNSYKENPDIPGISHIDESDDVRAMHGANALKASDARNMLMYRQWIKDNPLIDCIDEYDRSWVKYLLEQLNCNHGKSEAFGASIVFDDLKEAIKISDRNATTLTSFVVPENIADEDVYNNCWHDKDKKIWYVYDDHLDEQLQNQAVSDPDHSQSMCGRRVWGFAEDQVQMFCGLPSLVVETVLEKDTQLRITCSRDTGKPIELTYYKTRHFPLPILREDDITEELMDKYGHFTIQTESLKYSVDPSGGADHTMTPKMMSLFNKKYDIPQLPMNELARRAVFVSKCGGWFSAQSRIGVDDNDDNNDDNI